MNSIGQALSQLPGFHAMSPATEYEVARAEEELSTRFSSDYRECLTSHGLIDVNSHELTGLCPFPRLNVVDVTRREREFDQNVSSDLYVIELTGVDGGVAWQSPNGTVIIRYPDGNSIKVADSIIEYVSD